MPLSARQDPKKWSCDAPDWARRELPRRPFNQRAIKLAIELEFPASAKLRYTRGLHDRRPFLPVRKTCRLALIRIDATEPLAVAIEHGHHEMAVLAALVGCEIRQFSDLLRLGSWGCLVCFFHFPPIPSDIKTLYMNYANCIGLAQLVFGMERAEFQVLIE